MDLKTIWTSLATSYSNNQNLIAELWHEIEQAYTGSKRYYHNLIHIQYMIEKTHKMKDIKDIDSFLFAIFYHDIIYNAQRKDNEEKSAERAITCLKELNAPQNMIRLCSQHILATKAHHKNDHNDTNLLLDIDMGILGESQERYLEYAQNIRKEYAIYPNFMYKKGRKKVLQHFLDMKSIYKTKTFQETYEQQARTNIAYELDNIL